MKPGDHPEFFRLPPPAGRSRESSIVLKRDGRFFHEGAPVTHPGMRQAFASWLTRHPDDGRHILSNGYDWTYLTVEGASRFVQAVQPAAAGPLVVMLDGERLQLDPEAVGCDPDGQLWLRLPDSEPACFMPAAQLELSPWLEERAGAVGLLIKGRFTPVAALPPP